MAPQISWFAVQTKPRHEQTVAAALAGRQLEAYVPTYKAQRQWSDRVKRMDLPLFGNYVFCRMNPEVRLPVLTIPGVARIISFGNGPVPIDDAEIQAIQKVLASQLPVEPCPYVAGDSVVIRSGPLKGTTGILLHAAEQKGRYRLVVSVSLLQRSIAVAIDAVDAMPTPLAPPLSRQIGSQVRAVLAASPSGVAEAGQQGVC